MRTSRPARGCLTATRQGRSHRSCTSQSPKEPCVAPRPIEAGTDPRHSMTCGSRTFVRGPASPTARPSSQAASYRWPRLRPASPGPDRRRHHGRVLRAHRASPRSETREPAIHACRDQHARATRRLRPAGGQPLTSPRDPPDRRNLCPARRHKSSTVNGPYGRRPGRGRHPPMRLVAGSDRSAPTCEIYASSRLCWTCTQHGKRGNPRTP